MFYIYIYMNILPRLPKRRLFARTHHVRLAQSIAQPVALPQIKPDIATVDRIAPEDNETVHLDREDETIASALLPLYCERRGVELHAFLEVARGDHGHASVRRA